MPTPKSPNALLAELKKFAPQTEKLKDEINDAKERNKRKSSTWKPEPNKKHQIRILPYRHAKSGSKNPFIEAYFHWNVGEGQAYIVCPKKSDAANGGLGDECPICKLQKKLYATKDPNDASLAKLIKASLRWYVPILVRGEEEKGVQFYGFSAKTYETFVSLLTDPDYENLTDPVDGIDLTLTYTKDEKKKDDYGTVTILPKNKTSAIIPIPKDADDSEVAEIFETILELVNGVPNFFEDVFKPKTIEELEDLILQLDGGMSDDSESHTQKEEEEQFVEDDSDVAPPVDDDEEEEEEKKPKSSRKDDDDEDDEDDEKTKAEKTRRIQDTLSKFRTGAKQ